MTGDSARKDGWWRHAFAVDEPGPAEPDAEERPAVEWVCGQIAKRRLTTPGLIFLEMSRPLNWVAAQGMHGLSPFVWAIVRGQTHERYKAFTAFLERRGSMEYICRRIEALEDEYERARRAPPASAPDESDAPPDES